MRAEVTVIIPHHLNENDGYLMACVESIRSSDDIRITTIVISDAEHRPAILLHSSCILFHDKSLNNVTKKWHRGVSEATTPYVMLISDDVIVTKHTIKALAMASGDHSIVGPASNGDNGSRYHTRFLAGDTELAVKMDLSQVNPADVIDMPMTHPYIIPQSWISFYCTMFPRKLLEDVGDFDESLDVRYNDVDYCQRARAKGYGVALHLGVFALHFGDKTLPKVTSPEEYAKADESYRNKYRIV